MRTAVVFAAAIGIGVATAGQPALQKALIHPVVPGHGGVVALPGAAEPPRKGMKVVFDVTSDAKSGEVNKGLERVARLLNLYGASGLKAGDVRIAVVFHGEAAKTVLADAAYAERFRTDANPNLPLVRDLKKAGVELFVCGQAMHYKGYKTAEIDKNVPIAVAALTVVVNKQADGFAYVPVP